jgi:uncharacterized protein (TIGR02246 family)
MTPRTNLVTTGREFFVTIIRDIRVETTPAIVSALGKARTDRAIYYEPGGATVKETRTMCRNAICALSACLLFGGVGGLVAEPPSDVEQVKATLDAMWEAIEQGDAAAYAQYVHPDFTQFGEGDVYLAQGKDLEVASMRDYLKRVTDVRTEMHQPIVTVKGDVAWIAYYWTDSGIAGGERFTSRGKSTRIFVKEDGRWLCIHGHYTAVP